MADLTGWQLVGKLERCHFLCLGLEEHLLSTIQGKSFDVEVWWTFACVAIDGTFIETLLLLSCFVACKLECLIESVSYLGSPGLTLYLASHAEASLIRLHLL